MGPGLTPVTHHCYAVAMRRHLYRSPHRNYLSHVIGLNPRKGKSSMTDQAVIEGEPVILLKDVTHEPEVLVEHAHMSLTSHFTIQPIPVSEYEAASATTMSCITGPCTSSCDASINKIIIEERERRRRGDMKCGSASLGQPEVHGGCP